MLGGDEVCRVETILNHVQCVNKRLCTKGMLLASIFIIILLFALSISSMTSLVSFCFLGIYNLLTDSLVADLVMHPDRLSSCLPEVVSSSHMCGFFSEPTIQTIFIEDLIA